VSLVIAIDGPAAAGKGTLARRLAETLGFAYLDTGGLYRAVGLMVLRAGGDPSDPEAALRAALQLDAGRFSELAEDQDLRSESTGSAASHVAVMPPVRAALLDFQRRFAAHPPGDARGAVLDGRDIGTVICPDARVKLYVTASVEERARRRTRELQERAEAGIEAAVVYDRVLQELKDRDARDSQRAVAPLRPAEGAFVLDTSDMDADAALAAVVAHLGSVGINRAHDA